MTGDRFARCEQALYWFALQAVMKGMSYAKYEKMVFDFNYAGRCDGCHYAGFSS